jgi:hypothetical protein
MGRLVHLYPLLVTPRTPAGVRRFLPRMVNQVWDLGSRGIRHDVCDNP